MQTAIPTGASVPTFSCYATYSDDRARITAKGPLNVSSIPVLRRIILAAAVLPISGITLDLAGADSIDRAAVDALVSLQRQVREQSAAFALASMSEPIRLAFEIAGVVQLFDHESLWSGYPALDDEVA